MYILYLTILYIISSYNNGSHLLNFINPCSVPKGLYHTVHVYCLFSLQSCKVDIVIPVITEETQIQRAPTVAQAAKSGLEFTVRLQILCRPLAGVLTVSSPGARVTDGPPSALCTGDARTGWLLGE